MPTLLDTHNPSILAIPAYYILSVLPHTYALHVATQGKVLEWDNRNPRSTDMRAKLKTRLGPETYARYERLESCHANGMENMPLFVAAVVLGNLGGLPRDAMARFAASFLAVRVAYTVVYAQHSTQGPTVVRSLLWATGVTLCFRTIFAAAKALGRSA
jgi:uncharacterized MAPEG superfamily protein